jgi:heme exporter protein A
MLEANEISCVRGNRELFRHLSFRVEEGTALRIHGANGAGKTSLLRMVAGLSPVFDGGIRWDGRALSAIGDEFYSQLVFVGHANALKAHLTPCENVRLGLAIQGLSADEESVRTALDEEGLTLAADVPAQRLSAGQQRRVALTRTRFAAGRKLWILDEPFSSLDDAAVRRLSSRLAGHVRNGGVVVYTTHQNVEIDAPTSSLELA